MSTEGQSAEGVEVEPFGYETGKPFDRKPTARALAEAIAYLATNDRSGLIQRVAGLIRRDRATTNQTFDKLTRRAEAAEAENARIKEEVELATSQLELSTYTLAEAARREEAWFARLQAAEAREQEAVRALEMANTPDMFWDAENPESCALDQYDIAHTYAPGEIFRIQRARALPDEYGVYVSDPQNEDEWKYTFGTLEECEAVRAASIVKGEKP